MSFSSRQRKKRKKAAAWLRRREAGQGPVGKVSWSDEREVDPWYHVYGGEQPGLAETEAGETWPAWQVAVIGPSPWPPDSTGPIVGEDVKISDMTFPGQAGAPLAYLASFNVYPSVEQIDAVTPEHYRSDQAETVPLGTDTTTLPEQRSDGDA